MVHCQEPPSLPRSLGIVGIVSPYGCSCAQHEGLILGSGCANCSAFVTLAQGQEFLFLDQGSMDNKNPSTEACLR